ncbi:hypothetical protein [Nitrosococcus wardiae]|uniref:Uncharacterized protein n=1 Tax=Nitrosococcus wardiae TaxID=1814290 RepID=A0A4P7BY94_9GAMM|nr:hypothetical protein [Nitrosococcus wardiae]QBQ53376.1 hypothetical protein E3U44_01785 [Nitrosococcus wardiae]
MADRILPFVADYVLPALIMGFCAGMFFLGTLQAWELFLANGSLACLWEVPACLLKPNPPRAK